MPWQHKEPGHRKHWYTYWLSFPEYTGPHRHKYYHFDTWKMATIFADDFSKVIFWQDNIYIFIQISMVWYNFANDLLLA